MAPGGVEGVSGESFGRRGNGERMRIISKYVFRLAGSSFALILLSLTGIVWIALALRQFNVVTSEGQDTMMLVKLTSLALPNLIAVIAPFSLLIAALQTLNRLNTDSELIVLSATGSTAWTVARPIILLAVLVSCALAFVSHFAQPWSMRELREFMIKMRSDLLTQVIQPGRFSSPEPNLMFHIRDREVDGELDGLVLHDTRDQKQSQSYLAEHGVIVKQNDTAYLVMTTGHIIRRTDANEPPQIVAFDRYVVDLDRFEAQDSGGGDLRPRERYYDELLAAADKKTGQLTGPFRSEFHERFVSPLYPIAFVFVVIAFVGQSRSTRSSRIESLVIAFLVATAFRMAGFAVNGAASRSASMVYMMYAIPIGAIVLSLIIMSRAKRQKTGLAGIDMVVAMASAAATLVRSAIGRVMPGRIAAP